MSAHRPDDGGPEDSNLQAYGNLIAALPILQLFNLLSSVHRV
jgi:hypothetical protein